MQAQGRSSYVTLQGRCECEQQQNVAVTQDSAQGRGTIWSASAGCLKRLLQKNITPTSLGGRVKKKNVTPPCR